VTAKQQVVQVVIIPDQHEKGLMGMEGKTWRKGTFEDQSGKRHEKGEQVVQDQSTTMEKS